MIAHINFAKGFRGGERQTLLLIQVLARQGYEQLLVVRKNAPLIEHVKGIPGLSLIETGKPFIRGLKNIKNASIVHAHETKGAQFAYFAKLRYGIPYLITRRVDNPVKRNFFNRAMYRNASCVACVSTAIEKVLSKVGHFHNISIVPDAFSDLTHRQDTVAQLKERFADRFVITNIGELDNSHKGQFYLIEAMKLFAPKYPDIHLVLLGKGKDEANYRQQAGELKNISFEGFVDNVGDYLQVSELFAFPSLHEGLGSILLDIMKENIPIVASDVGGIPDIIRHNENGLLVEPGDSKQLYQAIEKLYLDEQLRKELAANGARTVGEYSPERMAERYIALYNQAL